MKKKRATIEIPYDDEESITWCKNQGRLLSLAIRMLIQKEVHRSNGNGIGSYFASSLNKDTNFTEKAVNTNKDKQPETLDSDETAKLENNVVNSETNETVKKATDKLKNTPKPKEEADNKNDEQKSNSKVDDENVQKIEKDLSKFMME